MKLGANMEPVTPLTIDRGWGVPRRLSVGGFARMGGMGVAALVCALGSEVLVMAGAPFSAPTGDLARNESPLNVIRDPFALPIAGPVTLCGALLGFGLALMLLWDTRLRRTIPIVLAATWLASASRFVLFLSALYPLAIVSGGSILRCSERSTTRRVQPRAS